MGRDKLWVWAGKSGGGEVGLAGVQADGEIKDAAQYQEIVKQKMGEVRRGATKVIVVLSKEVLYWRTEPAMGGRVNLGALKDFVSGLPIPSGKLASNFFAGQEELGVVAVNRDLFTVLTEELQKLGWEVTAVVPEVVVGEVTGENWQELFGARQKLVKESGIL